MEKNSFARLIAQQLNLQERAVDNTLALLDEGCTIPFISRYRKERTGGLDEVQIAAISTQYERFKEIQKRKEAVLKAIATLQILAAVFIVIHAQVNWDGKLPEDDEE